MCCCGLQTFCVVFNAVVLISFINLMSQDVSYLASGNGPPQKFVPKIIGSVVAILVFGMSFYGTFKKKEKLILPSLIYIPIASIGLILREGLKKNKKISDNYHIGGWGVSKGQLSLFIFFYVLSGQHLAWCSHHFVRYGQLFEQCAFLPKVLKNWSNCQKTEYHILGEGGRLLSFYF